MTLATLAAVKNKLDIPATDVSLDNPITVCLTAADSWVKDQTGFDEAATVRTEYLTQVEHDAWISTKYRPVDSAYAIVAQSRAPGSTTRSTLTADLVDPDAGKIKLVPVGSSGAPWEHSDDGGEHTIVELTYKTKAFAASTDGAEIPDVIASLAAYWFRESRALAKSITVGAISETLMNLPVPPHIVAALWRHKRGSVRCA